MSLFLAVMIALSYNWKDLNFSDLYETKKGSIKRTGIQSYESFENNLRTLNKIYKRFFNSNKDPIGIITYSNGLPVGSILLYVQSSKKLEINPWELRGHPWITQYSDKKVIISQLLKKAIEFAKENGYSNIVLSITKKDSQPEEYIRYLHHGFQFHHESVGMNIHLDNYTPSKVLLPDEFNLKNLGEIDPKSLFKPYYETLRDNATHYFYDYNLLECEDFFLNSIMKSDECENPLSVVLYDKEKVVGFSFVMEYNTNFHFLDWIGIHPDYRGKGYGKLLLSYVMNKAKARGVTEMGLSCDTQNNVAYWMYKQFGWMQDEHEITLAWTLASNKGYPKNKKLNSG
ncbi:MAG: GNAT family N-acetyltransferase [Candidatus Thorarchaeota archaeon]